MVATVDLRQRQWLLAVAVSGSAREKERKMQRKGERENGEGRGKHGSSSAFMHLGRGGDGRRHGRPRGSKPQNSSATFKSSRPAQKPLKNRLNHYYLASLSPKLLSFDTRRINKYYRAI